jgi:hypothetical protein
MAERDERKVARSPRPHPFSIRPAMSKKGESRFKLFSVWSGSVRQNADYSAHNLS